MEQEIEERIRKAIGRTWKAIKPDTLCDLTSDPDAVGKVMSQKGIRETVADPSYLEIYGKDEKAMKTSRSLSEEEKKKILEKVFPGNPYNCYATYPLRGAKMVPEQSKEAYICKTCGKIAEEKHLCNPAKGQKTCRFCGKTVEVTRHMCRKKLEQTQYFCSLCGRLSVNEQYLCNPEEIS